jgi:deoxyribose-phosphate aldolase
MKFLVLSYGLYYNLSGRYVAYATWEDIQTLCKEAIEYKTASVCIPPCYIKRVNEKYGDNLNICTVIGFPLGYSTTEAKTAECRQALADGANELDMVINISDVKNGDYDKVEKEIETLKNVVGDKVLKEIADLIMKNTRTSDYIGRYGGEEFIIILPDTGIEMALKIAEDIRRDIQNHSFEIKDLKVTISIGVVNYTGQSPNALINRADILLYQAKSKGRNRVEH